MFSNRASSPPKGSVPIRAFCVIRFFMLFMIKVLWAVMCVSTHLPSRLECQQRGLNSNTPFILDNLIGSHHPGDTLIKVRSWFCLERDWGRPSARVTEIREWSNRASIRKTEIIFKASARAAFRNPWSPDPLCLPVFFSRPCHGWGLMGRLLAGMPLGNIGKPLLWTRSYIRHQHRQYLI